MLARTEPLKLEARTWQTQPPQRTAHWLNEPCFQNATDEHPAHCTALTTPRFAKRQRSGT
eukprot:3110474-Alexandrium_andersonii.AAC.1